MRANCKHFDESISMDENMCTIVAIENPTVLGKILYSLDDVSDDYFCIYDENFKEIPDKNLITVIDPVAFDFEDRKIKTIITNYILNCINDNTVYKEELEESFLSLAINLDKYINDYSNVEFITPMSFDIKDIIKALGINIDSKDVISIYEKIMLILNVLNEMTVDKVVIFANLSMLVSKEEYCSIVEMINLHSTRVLMLEGTQQFLKDLSYYYMDYDFCMGKVSGNML